MTHEASFSQTLNHLDLRGIRLLSRQSRDFLSLAVDQDDLDVGPISRVRLSATTPIKITGIKSIGIQGREIQLVNVGSVDITLSHLDAGSLTRHQFDNQSGVDFVMSARSVIDVFYDAVIDNWRVRIPGGIAGPPGPPSPTAATIVVNQAAGEGDATTIAAGIALLPAGGGTVYVEQGTYAIAATITLPDKPIRIIGAATDGASVPKGTILDMGANVFDLFTIAAGGTGFREYVFENLTILGTGVAGQDVIRPLTAFPTITFRNLNIQEVDKVVDAVGASAVTLLIRNTTIFTANTLYDGVTGTVIEMSDFLAFLNGPVGVGGTPSCQLTNGNFNKFAGSVSFTMAAGSSFQNVRFVLAALTVPATCVFTGVSSFGTLFTITGVDTIFTGCLFETAAKGITTSSTRGTVSGCRFTGVTIPVEETGGADFNIFTSLNGFTGSVIIGPDTISSNNID